MADIKYIVKADTKGAVKEFKKVDASINGMKAQAQKSVSPLKGMFTQLGKGLVATAAVGIAMKKLVKFMGDAIAAAQLQELAEKGMTDALASTGREVPINAEHFKRYASELQQATLYGDEQILSAQALLIQLTDLDQKGLDKATKGALGMATVFKTDLKSATNLIAKALAGNYGALSRYGISVADLNTEEEKRASLMEQLGVLYERAKGETDTYAGVVTQLKNTFGDFKEKIGDVIVKSQQLRSDVSLIQSTMANFIESGTMDNWAAKFDMIVHNVPIFDSLRKSLLKLNWQMEVQIMEQKIATAQGEAWYEYLKNADEKLVVFGVDLYDAMRKFAGFNEEVESSSGTKIPKLITKFEEAKLKMFEFTDVVEDGEIWLAKMALEGEETGGVLEDVFKELGWDYKAMTEGIEDDTKSVTAKIESEWSNATERMKDLWARELGDMLEGAESFKEGVAAIWGEMKSIFFDMIAKMIVKWGTALVTEMVSTTKKAASGISNSMAKIGKGISGVGAGLGGLIVTLAKSVSKAATIIAENAVNILIAAGVALAIYTGFKLIGSLFASSAKPGSEKDLLRKIADATIGARNVLFIDILPMFWQLIDRLDPIRDNTRNIYTTLLKTNRLLAGMPSGQSGLEMQSGSSGGFARYHPNERISITPHLNFSPQFQTVVVEKNDKYIIKVVQDNLNRLNLRVPAGAMK